MDSPQIPHSHSCPFNASPPIQVGKGGRKPPPNPRGTHLGEGCKQWGSLARQGGVLGGCSSEGVSCRAGCSGSFSGGLLSFGGSPRRVLALSSATSTSKSLARPCTSRRW